LHVSPGEDRDRDPHRDTILVEGGAEDLENGPVVRDVEEGLFAGIR
jgi:hypothetical protein